MHAQSINGLSESHLMRPYSGSSIPNDIAMTEGSIHDSIVAPISPSRRYQALLLASGFLMTFQTIGINSVFGIFQVRLPRRLTEMHCATNVSSGILHLFLDEYPRCSQSRCARIAGWYNWCRTYLERKHICQPYDCEDGQSQNHHSARCIYYEPWTFPRRFLYPCESIIKLEVSRSQRCSWSTIHKLWQLYLTQALMYGIGSSMFYFPIMSTAPVYFDRHRGFAMGVILAGSGVGGVVIGKPKAILMTQPVLKI